MMAGKRQVDSDLPPRMYAYEKKNGHKTYYFVDTFNKRHNLGRHLEEALKTYTFLAEHIPSDMVEKLAKDLYIKARKRANAAGIAFELTISDIADILKRSKGKCEITGLKFNDDQLEGKRIKPWARSLDRIESSLHYTPSNTRMVCAYVNLALNEFGIDMLKTLMIGLAHKGLSDKRNSDLTKL